MSESDRAPREQATREEESEHEGPVIRDKRRVDPETGKVREPAKGSVPASPGAEAAADSAEAPAEGTVVDNSAPAGPEGSGTDSDEVRKLSEQVESLQTQLSERLADVKRVQAEYANYRKRVDRDREAVREQALANVLENLIPVLDDIARAREHGELEGGFRQVGESLEQIAGKLGLVRYGEPGDAFDPLIHDALMHSYSNDVTQTTCAQVLQPGYAVNERVLRPARVAVSEPPEQSGEVGSEGAGFADGSRPEGEG